jgi:Protein of unknown function (DUF3822)
MQTHKLKTKVRDDLFNADAIAHYFLCLKLDKQHIELAAFDTKIDRCVLYEYHDFLTEDESLQVVGLANFIKTHPFLPTANWKAIYFMDCGLQYSFVPEEYHHANYGASFLRLNADIQDQPISIQQTQHITQGCYCHFALPKSLVDWSTNLYRGRNVIWIHQTAAFLEGVTKNPDRLDITNLHVLVNNDTICIANFKNGKLNFLNSFAYQDQMDMVYFVLLVIKELGIDNIEAKVWLYGGNDKVKTSFSLLSKYVKNIKISSRPKSQNFGYRFDELETYQAYDLFSSYYFIK